MKRLVFIIVCLFVLYTVHSQDSLRRPKVGLVLSGGGAKGMAHVGVLKVIEKAGIHIDYIGGTSMGAIVGAFYAMGYPADTIEKIFRTANWDYILSDKPLRERVAMEEKDDFDRYFISFPVNERKIQLPSGVQSGQNILNYMSTLCSPVMGIDSFKNFPIPYLCVACDLVTSKPVVIKSGYLPDALRASMAIPTAFTPVERDGTLLIDGGMANNFPVNEVKNMGADIIIGSYTGYTPYDKEKLKSFLNVMYQIVFFNSRAVLDSNKKMCNVYIAPDISGFHLSNFKDYDSLFVSGEKAGMKAYPELLKLADSLRRFDLQAKNIPCPDYRKGHYITGLEFEGLKKVSVRLVKAKMKISFPMTVTPDEIDQAIQRLYGTQYFDKVTYRIEPVPNGVKLILRFEEKEEDVLKVGIHSDNDMRTLVMLGYEKRNLFVHGSKFSAYAGVGENPHYEVKYTYNLSWKPDLSLNFRLNGFGYNINQYTPDLKQVDYMNKYFNQTFRLYTQYTIKNSYAFSGGLEWQYNRLHPDYYFFDLSGNGNNYLNYYASFKWDTYRKVYFPNQGYQLVAEVRMVNDLFRGSVTNTVTNLFTSGSYVIPLGRKTSLILSDYVNLNLGDSACLPYCVNAGGMWRYDRPLAYFVGYPFGSIQSNMAIVGRCDLQYEFADNHYLVAKVNAGQFMNHFDKILDEKIKVGYGLTYGYETPFGPLEFSLMTHDVRYIIAAFNIGLWF